MKIPDYTMAEADAVFRQIGYTKPRETTYPEAWRAIRAMSYYPQFNDMVEAAIRKHIPQERQ